MPSKIFKITRYSCVVISPNYKMMTVVIFRPITAYVCLRLMAEY